MFIYTCNPLSTTDSAEPHKKFVDEFCELVRAEADWTSLNNLSEFIKRNYDYILKNHEQLGERVCERRVGKDLYRLIDHINAAPLEGRYMKAADYVYRCVLWLLFFCDALREEFVSARVSEAVARHLYAASSRSRVSVYRFV